MNIKDCLEADYAYSEPKVAKLVRRIMQDAREDDLAVRTSSGSRTIKALFFDVSAFVGGPVTLALHPSLESCGKARVTSWTCTEPRTGLSAGTGYIASDAVRTALSQTAFSIAAEGRGGFEKRIAAQMQQSRGRTSE